MSHLIIEQGKEVGTEVTVPPTGMKFGRSPANDLVLEDDEVMLFQGRFFFKSDATLWATDFSAGNKTKVDGKPIDEHPLKVGDLVEVGGSAFRVINTKQDSQDTPAPEVAPLNTAENEVDLGFKPAKGYTQSPAVKERSKSSSLIHRLLQVGAILLLLGVLVVAAPELMKLGASSDTVAAPQEDSLSFVYERVMGNRENILRYYLELTPEGKASIKIDDLKNRHITKTVEIPEKVLENLSRRIEGTGFLELEEDLIGESRYKHELYDIAMSRNGRFNQIRVLNREQPSEMKQTISILEDFVFGELDVPFTLLEEPEVLRGYAQEAFKLGESKLAEMDVQHKNLSEAIKHFKESIVYLETLEPKPDLYREAQQKMQQARELQDERYKDYMFNVDRAIRLEDWPEASKNLRILAELISDRSDERHEIISSKQLDVEEHVR